MWFWVFMLVMNLLTPIIMIGYGIAYRKNAPKDMNASSGYRTAMSMKNRDTWEFAHQYFEKLWFMFGTVCISCGFYHYDRACT